MGKATPIQTDFTGGEVSPRLYARVDLRKHNSSVKYLENFIPYPHGGITKRPGTEYLGDCGYEFEVGGIESPVNPGFIDDNKRLIPFSFSTTQSYVLEFGHRYIRFWRDGGQVVEDIGNGLKRAYELHSAYESHELRALNFTQSADVLYLTHPDHAPKTLSRYGVNDWRLNSIGILDGPYGRVNSDLDHTMKASALSGDSVRVVSSKSFFNSRDLGRWIRLSHATGTKDTYGKYLYHWGAGKISGVTDSKNVFVDVLNLADLDMKFQSTDATTEWRLGAWGNGDEGWPSCITFYQERLFFSGSKAQPNTVWSSMSGDFKVFSPSTKQHEVLDSSALSMTLSTNQVNAIEWMIGAKQLQIGTSNATFTISSGQNNTALTPTNVTAGQETGDGSAMRIDAIAISKSSLYVDSSKRKIREFAYVYETDGFSSPDMSIMSEHLFDSPIKEITHINYPYSLLWVLLESGELRCLTYEREHKVVAWSRQVLAGPGAKVISITSIPSSDGSEHIYMVVKRIVGGKTWLFVERFFPFPKPEDSKKKLSENCIYADCASKETFNTPARKITGFFHLENEFLDIVSNGIAEPSQQVKQSSLSLLSPSSAVTIGYKFLSKVITLTPHVQVEEGPSQGKTMRVEAVSINLVDTYGLKAGASKEHLELIEFNEFGSKIGQIELFTGLKKQLVGFTPGAEFNYIIQHGDMYPCTIASLLYAFTTSSR